MRVGAVGGLDAGADDEGLEGRGGALGQWGLRGVGWQRLDC